MLQHPAATPADDPLVRGQYQVGSFQLIVCTDGPFLLDGGATFGVIPKTLWAQRMPADAANNVLLGTNTVVVRGPAALVVIETGIGNKQPPKLKTFSQNSERLPASLAAAGIDPLDVTHVINTHLHFDHCGWNTTLHAGGSVIPTFPNARYFCAAGELAHGRLQLDRDRVSYRTGNYDPLIAAGQLTVVDPGGAFGFTAHDPRLAHPDHPGAFPHLTTSTQIAPGIRVETRPGHTRSMLAVHIEDAGEHACYISDLMPTHHHLDPTWVMGFDLDPLGCIAERKRFLAEAVAGNWLVLFTHDHGMPAARLHFDERGKPWALAEPSPAEPSLAGTHPTSR